MMTDSPSPEVEQVAPTGDVAVEWRKARFEELGFNGSESLALAKSTTTEYTGGKDDSKRLEWHPPLNWTKVKKALDAGCDHATALEIFVT